MRRIAINVGLILAVSLPLFILLVWAAEMLVGPGSTEEMLGSFAFAYIVLLPPAAGGALLQQLATTLFARRYPETNRRVLAVASCVLIYILSPFFLVGPKLLIYPAIFVPALIALLVFGMIQRLPTTSASETVARTSGSTRVK
jgi:hypothetical protein